MEFRRWIGRGERERGLEMEIVELGNIPLMRISFLSGASPRGSTYSTIGEAIARAARKKVIAKKRIVTTRLNKW